MPPNSPLVTRTVRAPSSAARRAASTPAGPAPITIMSVISAPPRSPRAATGGRKRQHDLRSDQFTQCLLTAVRRVAQIGVDRCVVVQDAACVRVGPKAPLAVVLAHPGIADTPKGQIRNERLDGAFVDARVAGSG